MLGSVLRDAAQIAAGGIVLGVSLTLLLSRFLRSFVFEVETTDPTVLLSVAGLAFGVTLLAALIPAHRAGRIDPVTALASDG